MCASFIFPANRGNTVPWFCLAHMAGAWYSCTVYTCTTTVYCGDGSNLSYVRCKLYPAVTCLYA